MDQWLIEWSFPRFNLQVALLPGKEDALCTEFEMIRMVLLCSYAYVRKERLEIFRTALECNTIRFCFLRHRFKMRIIEFYWNSIVLAVFKHIASFKMIVILDIAKIGIGGIKVNPT